MTEQIQQRINELEQQYNTLMALLRASQEYHELITLEATITELKRLVVTEHNDNAI